MNEELTLAIEELRQRPIDKTWFIPVSFSSDSIPARDIGAGQTLRDIQWLDLSAGPDTPEWTSAIKSLVSVLDTHAESHSSEQSSAFVASIKASVSKRAEASLLNLLKSNARDTIDAALDAFVADEDSKRYDYVMRPLCEVYGGQFSREQVVRLVTRGSKGNSRTGFHGLCILYEHHFEHMRGLKLLDAFTGNFQISYFIRLRERHPGKELLTIVMKTPAPELKIEGAYVDSDYFFDKFMNRGESAFLDAVFSLDDETKAPSA